MLAESFAAGLFSLDILAFIICPDLLPEGSPEEVPTSLPSSSPAVKSNEERSQNARSIEVAQCEIKSTDVILFSLHGKEKENISDLVQHIPGSRSPLGIAGGRAELVPAPGP